MQHRQNYVLLSHSTQLLSNAVWFLIAESLMHPFTAPTMDGYLSYLISYYFFFSLFFPMIFICSHSLHIIIPLHALTLS